MKFLLLLLLLLPFNSVAQNLSYNDLKIILSKSVVESNNFLENKGYRIFETNTNNEDNQISYIWDKYGKPHNTVSYLLITWDKSKDYKMVWYQFHTLSQFNRLKSEIEKIGFKLIDSYVKFESLYYVYNSTNYSISMSKGEKDFTISIRYNWDKILRNEITPRY